MYSIFRANKLWTHLAANRLSVLSWAFWNAPAPMSSIQNQRNLPSLRSIRCKFRVIIKWGKISYHPTDEHYPSVNGRKNTVSVTKILPRNARNTIRNATAAYNFLRTLLKQSDHSLTRCWWTYIYLRRLTYPSIIIIKCSSFQWWNSKLSYIYWPFGFKHLFTPKIQHPLQVCPSFHMWWRNKSWWKQYILDLRGLRPETLSINSWHFVFHHLDDKDTSMVFMQLTEAVEGSRPVRKKWMLLNGFCALVRWHGGGCCLRAKEETPRCGKLWLRCGRRSTPRSSLYERESTSL